MYLESGNDYYLASLTGIDIVTKNDITIRSPDIKFRLLSFSEYCKVQTMIQSGMKSYDINEEIVSTCVLGIIGFDSEVIDYEESAAFVCDHIADKIRLNTELMLKDLKASYDVILSTITRIEQVAMMVSHYSATPYATVIELPLDMLFKRYAICATVFPNFPELVPEEVKQSRIG